MPVFRSTANVVTVERTVFVIGVALSMMSAQLDGGVAEGEAACAAHAVRIEAYDSFRDELTALILVDGRPVATTPNTVDVRACAPVAVVVRNVASGEERSLDARSGDHLRVDFPGRHTATVLSAVGSLDWVKPGWGDGHMTLGGGGARLDWWGRFAHLTAAVRLTNYGYRWVVRPPVWPVVDLFAGLGYAVGTDALRAHFALDLGAWAYATPTLRACVALALGRHFITGTFDTHLYPEGLLPMGQSRRRGYENVPIENFVFWGFELAYGWRF